jgi:hypothetical protein
MEHGTMMQSKIDEAALMWNKTKNPYYKNLWYKLIREFYGRVSTLDNDIYNERGWLNNENPIRVFSCNDADGMHGFSRRSQRSSVNLRRKKK